MSVFNVLGGISETLRELLEDHITRTPIPELHNVPIQLRSPKAMAQDQNPLGISLWLYRVTRNADMLNVPPRRIPPDQSARHELPVDLHYLLTPFAGDPKDEQRLLGRVLQTFNDHSKLRGADLHDVLQDTPVELRLSMETPTLEELTKIWTALQEPYKLSVMFMVELAVIDSDHEPVQGAPVLVREMQTAQILQVR